MALALLLGVRVRASGRICFTRAGSPTSSMTGSPRRCCCARSSMRRLDRAGLANGPREGETGGLRWSVAAEPMFVDAMVPQREEAAPVAADKNREPDTQASNWIAFHLVATVSWAPGQMVTCRHPAARIGRPRNDRRCSVRRVRATRGFTLIEVLAALAIGSAVIAATAVLINNVALNFDRRTGLGRESRPVAARGRPHRGGYRVGPSG